MYGSFVKPKMAGIESRAKIKSVNAIATKTMVNEEAPLFLNQTIVLPSFHSFSWSSVNNL
jgi:hypothetical protein